MTARGYTELGRTEWPIAVRLATEEYRKHIYQMNARVLIMREWLKKARARSVLAVPAKSA